MEMQHLETWFSVHCGDEWMVGLDDLRGPFQPLLILWIYDWGHKASQRIKLCHVWIQRSQPSSETSHNPGKGSHYSPILREAVRANMIFLALSVSFKKVMGEKWNVHGTHKALTCSTETASHSLSPHNDFMIIGAVSICHRKADQRS